MKVVTSSSSVKATTSGPTPARAAASVAARSASRSMPSADVFAPNSRTTKSPRSVRTLKLRLVIPPSSGWGSSSACPISGRTRSMSDSDVRGRIGADLDRETCAIAAVAVVCELDRGPVSRIRGALHEHQRRALGNFQRRRFMGARQDWLEALDGAHGAELVEVAHQVEQRAGETKTEQARERRGRDPRVLERERHARAVAQASYSIGGGTRLD